MEISYHPEAKDEMREAARFYENRREGLGDTFLAAIDAANEQLKAHPHRWPFIHEPYRRILVDRFPYAVVYRIGKSMVRVIAVAHGKRRPLYWLDRTDGDAENGP